MFAKNINMTPRETILNMAKDRDIKTAVISKAMRYTHVNSFYRALNHPNKISYMRLKKLAKVLGINICELTEILK